MSFDAALMEVKNGKRVKRQEWDKSSGDPKYNYISNNGAEWYLGTKDILAEDWMVLV